MSEFDEWGETQDFEEPTMDNVEFSEADEILSDDCMDSVEVGDIEEPQMEDEVYTEELQEYDTSSEVDDSASDYSNDVQSEDDFPSYDQIEESELSPAELREQSEMEAAEAQRVAEEWADENGLDTWSDGSPRQGGDIVDESDYAVEELQEEPELSPAELREQSEMEAAEAQRVAEEWADAGDANRWSDGSLRDGHEDDLYDRSTNEL